MEAPDQAAGGRTPWHGKRLFTALAVGQIASIVGSELTFFGLGVWIFQETNSVTLFAMVPMATAVTSIVLAPVAGTLVDRWDRRRLLMISDALGLVATLGIVALFVLGRLAPWHVFVATACSAAAKAIQMPAFVATTPLIVPARHLGRASGLLQLAEGTAQVAAPVLAALVLATAGLEGVLLIDFATFLVSLGILLRIRLPDVPRTTEPRGTKIRWREVTAGWRYVARDAGLVYLLAFFCLVNFLLAMVQVLVPPFILKMASTTVLGAVTSVAGAGTLAGSLLMTLWGGPWRRIRGIAAFGVMFGVSLMLAGISRSMSLLAACGFAIFLWVPLLTGTVQAFWASRVAPDLQGRVYAVRMVLGWTCMSMAYLVAGPLADDVFEPLLAPGGQWVDTMGRLVGVGSGRGIAALFVFMGALCVVSAVALYLPRRVRALEDSPGSRARAEV